MISLIEPLVTRDEVLSRAGELTMPALVLHGAEDGAYPAEKAERLAAALPGSPKAIIIPGGAHFLSLNRRRGRQPGAPRLPVGTCLGIPFERLARVVQDLLEHGPGLGFQPAD